MRIVVADIAGVVAVVAVVVVDVRYTAPKAQKESFAQLYRSKAKAVG